jgi:hypothetical protein
MTVPFRPSTPSPSQSPPPHAPPPSRTSLQHRRCDAAVRCPRSHCPAPNHGPSQAASASQAHTPRRRLAHALLLLSHSHTRPPSRCTTRCDAWLTRVTDSISLQTDLLACFDCETLLPPLLRFRVLQSDSPRLHHPIPVPRDFTFTSGYLCFTLRRFTSPRAPFHAHPLTRTID